MKKLLQVQVVSYCNYGMAGKLYTLLTVVCHLIPINYVANSVWKGLYPPLSNVAETFDRPNFIKGEGYTVVRQNETAGTKKGPIC